MREKIVAGNWKMNNDPDAGKKLINEIATLLSDDDFFRDPHGLKIILCPPFLTIPRCMSIFNTNTAILPGAQNCHSEEKGAYTGEISSGMLKSAGVQYVIIGHSERRHYFNEDNKFLFEKTNAALRVGLIPIFCCGEVLTERESGNHFDVVQSQLTETIFNLDEINFSKIIIAYEPVWAIGTGLTATPEQAQEMHRFIRQLIEGKFGINISQNTKIIYGGSCNAANAAEIFIQTDVDGGLIGGASLKAHEFIAIAKSALEIMKLSK